MAQGLRSQFSAAVRTVKTSARAGNKKSLSQVEEPVQREQLNYASANLNAGGIAARIDGQSRPIAPAQPGQARPLQLLNDTEAAGNQPSQTPYAGG